MSKAQSPFPLEGGRAGDGGVALVSTIVTHERTYERPSDNSIARAQRLRKEAPLAERLLWAELRKLKLNIRRQAPIGPYVADFAHHPSRVVIEVDGYFHTLEGRGERDVRRDEWLKSQGYRVVRISEHDAREKTREMAERVGVYISRVLTANAARNSLSSSGATPPSPALTPPKGKGEEGGRGFCTPSQPRPN